MIDYMRAPNIKTKVNYKLIAVKRFIALFAKYICFGFKSSRFKLKAVPRLTIETTNFCMSKCVFCAYRYMQRLKQHLDMDLFKKAVNEYIEMGGVNLALCTVLGEPTCDPFLLERIKYVKKNPEIRSLGFITNLQNLHQFDIHEFVNSGITSLSISVVLSGGGKYYEFFGVDLYSIVLKNLVLLLTENKKCNNKICIKIDIKPTNEPKENIINHPDFKLINSLVDQDLVATVEEIYYFVDDWCNVVNLPRYLKKRPLYPRFFKPCAFIVDSAVVFSNGNVGVCPCRDYNADSELILGNLKEASLKELMQGDKRFKLFSEWRKWNKIPRICRRCSHYVY